MSERGKGAWSTGGPPPPAVMSDGGDERESNLKSVLELFAREVDEDLIRQVFAMCDGHVTDTISTLTTYTHSASTPSEPVYRNEDVDIELIQIQSRLEEFGLGDHPRVPRGNNALLEMFQRCGSSIDTTVETIMSMCFEEEATTPPPLPPHPTPSDRTSTPQSTTQPQPPSPPAPASTDEWWWESEGAHEAWDDALYDLEHGDEVDSYRAVAEAQAGMFMSDEEVRLLVLQIESDEAQALGLAQDEAERERARRQQEEADNQLIHGLSSSAQHLDSDAMLAMMLEEEERMPGMEQFESGEARRRQQDMDMDELLAQSLIHEEQEQQLGRQPSLSKPSSSSSSAGAWNGRGPNLPKAQQAPKPAGPRPTQPQPQPKAKAKAQAQPQPQPKPQPQSQPQAAGGGGSAGGAAGGLSQGQGFGPEQQPDDEPEPLSPQMAGPGDKPVPFAELMDRVRAHRQTAEHNFRMAQSMTRQGMDSSIVDTYRRGEQRAHAKASILYLANLNPGILLDMGADGMWCFRGYNAGSKCARVVGSGAGARLVAKIDVHGLHVIEVKRLIQTACLYYSRQESVLQTLLKPPHSMYGQLSYSGPSLVFLEVVTGRGAHSLQGRSKIKPGLEDLLTKHGKELDVHSWKEAENNPGAIVLTIKATMRS